MIPAAMAALLDFLPLIVFFAAFKWQGIFVATGALIVATLAVTAYTWITQRTVSKLALAGAGIALVLGGATLLLRDEQYVKLKATVVWWLFAAAFLASNWIGEKPLWQRALDNAFEAPRAVWLRANTGWAAFFAALGAGNLWLIEHVDTATWVTVKVWGGIACTFAFTVAQVVYLSRAGRLREQA
jgi:intracellular septation protein